MKLIIVESPAKAQALQGFLEREYEALATMEAWAVIIWCGMCQ